MSFANAWNHFQKSVEKMGGKNAAEIYHPAQYELAQGLINMSAGLTNLEERINLIELRLNQNR
jgi:hypothetical protein